MVGQKLKNPPPKKKSKILKIWWVVGIEKRKFRLLKKVTVGGRGGGEKLIGRKVSSEMKLEGKKKRSSERSVLPHFERAF